MQSLVKVVSNYIPLSRKYYLIPKERKFPMPEVQGILDNRWATDLRKSVSADADKFVAAILRLQTNKKQTKNRMKFKGLSL